VDKAHREKYNVVVQELFNPRSNWSNLRAKLQSADTPLITPFNLILHDLAMMSEHDTYQDQQEKFVRNIVYNLNSSADLNLVLD
jgi:hypothetical protein